MGKNAEDRWCLPVDMPSAREKVVFSSTSRSHKLQDRVGAFRAARTVDRLPPDSNTSKMESARLVYSCPPKISRSHIPRGPPQRESRRVEELVKYMSEVPAYLQLLERGNTNQEKALNMGVLDWSNLQKWTDRRRPLKAQESPSSCGAPTPSTCRSSGGSNTHRGNQLPFSEPPQHSPVDKDCGKPEEHKKSSQMFASFLSSTTDFENTSGRLPQPQSPGLAKEDTCGIFSEKFSCSTSDGSTCSSQEVNTSVSTSSEFEIPSSSEIKDHPSKLRTHHVEGRSNSRFCNKDEIQECPKTKGQCLETLPVYSQEVANGRLSIDSSVSESEVQASDGGCPSGILSGDVSFTSLYSDVPHSCPLPSSIEDWGWSETVPITTGNFLGASDDLFTIPPQVNLPTTSRFSCNLELADRFTLQTPKLKMARGNADSMLKEAHETLHGLNGVCRSSSLTEFEVRKPAGPIAHLDEMNGDKISTTSRGRRSPLRRMLDPLLKPRMSLRCPESVASSPASFVRRLSFSDKSLPRGETVAKDAWVPSSKGRSSSSAGQEARRLAFSAWACESRSALQGGKHERSKMQALLRLAWKNDLPLFTFSINDDDILVSTRKKTFSDKQDVECTYSFHYVRESKKKGGGWRSQGNKSKRQELVSKVVGRMDVSRAHLSDLSGSISATHFSVREFVLFGAEVRPSALETSQLLPESEIAAIVVKSSTDSSCDGSDSLCSDNQSLVSGCENIVAILPSEVHGLSEAGSPSPLIQRWRSGGSCDCGGWDVGCSLSILTENMHERCQSQRSSPHTQRTELVIQGGSKRISPVFSLVPFNEGLFTVDFDESISVLQAFSICIALLHRRKLHIPPKLQSPRQQQVLEGDVLLKTPPATRGKAPASYGSYHPPLSPVGRA